MGVHVCLKVSPMKNVMRYGKKGKLSSRYVRPFEVMEKVCDTLDPPPTCVVGRGSLFILPVHYNLFIHTLISMYLEIYFVVA